MATTKYGKISPDHSPDLSEDEHSVLGQDYLGQPPPDEENDRTPLTIQPDEPGPSNYSQQRSQPVGGSSASRPTVPVSSIPADRTTATSSAGWGDSSTIDESVWATLRRDLVSVWEKMQLVLWPKYLLGGVIRGRNPDRQQEQGQAGLGLVRDLAGRLPEAADMVLQAGPDEKLRDWDLWGPLLFCLLLAFLLSHGAQEAQKSLVFSGVFAIVWVGEAVVTLQIALLGGTISFFQTICVIGYTLFPLVIAALLSALDLSWIVRLPVDIVMVLWSLAAGVSILGGSGVVKNRVGLAVYPLFVFYLGLGCLCFVT